MTGVWTYPWTLYGEGVAAACEELASKGVDKLAVSAHHHAIRVFQPRLSRPAFDGGPGGCYFAPSPARFEDTPIQPVQAEVDGSADPLTEIVAVADEYGLKTTAWTYILHNPRLANAHPAFQIEDVFGNAYGHAFCLSHPEVRRYYAAVVAECAARGINAIELQGAKYPSVFHGQRLTAGIDARQVLTTDADEQLFSQCFCDACRCAARKHDVDIDRAQTVVQKLIEQSMRRPGSESMALSDLVYERPILGDLFQFRNAVVDSLVEEIAEAAGDVAVNAYVRQVGPDWSSGLTLSTLERHVDRITHTCYVSDPNVARDRIRTLQRSVDLPLDAGVTIDPTVIDSKTSLTAVVDAIRAETDGQVSVFNHAMMTDEQLNWVSALSE